MQSSTIAPLLSSPKIELSLDASVLKVATTPFITDAQLAANLQLEATIHAEQAAQKAAEAAAEALAAQQAADAAARLQAAQNTPVASPVVSYANMYDWGQCTYGVANWIRVPGDLGNANQWAWRAAAEGFSVSNVPRINAVAQTSVGYYGHVALVIAISGNQVEVQEMNYAGLNVVDTRWTSVGDWSYIYF